MTETKSRKRRRQAPAKSPTYLLVSEKVGKDAVAFLRQRRNRGLSWRGISHELFAQHGVDVTEVTLRKWLADAETAR